MKKIISLDVAKLRNAEHVQLHTNIRNIIEQAGSEECGIADDVYDPYRHAISDEQDIVKNSYASLFTKEMVDADKERIRGLRLVYNRFLNVENEASTSASAALWPKVEHNIANVYSLTKMSKLAYNEKTAVISGFILDARTTFNTQELTTLGVSAALEDLEVLNQVFSNKYIQRANERAEATAKLGSIVRGVTDSAWGLMAIMLEASANNPAANKAAMAKAAAGVIDTVNVVLNEAKQRVSQRYGNSGAEIAAINVPSGAVLPFILSDEEEVKVLGKNLDEKKLTMSLVFTAEGNLPSSRVMAVAEFCKEFGATAEASKDAVTGYEVINISGYTFAGAQVVLESIE